MFFSKNFLSKNNLVILTMVAGMFLWAFSAGIVNISLPTIAQYLDISTELVSWVIISHLIVLVGLLLVFGRLADSIGYRKVFMYGIFFFITASYLCGLALDFTSLIICRLIQGIGSAMLLSVAPAIITSSTNNQNRGQAFGYISIATTLGLSLGYLTGGWVTEYYGWNLIFFLNVPMGILIILLSYYTLKDYKQKLIPKNLDLAGSFLLIAMFTLLIISLQLVGDPEVEHFYAYLGIIASLFILIIFIIWENRYSKPLIDLKIFKNIYLTLSVISSFLTSLVLTGTIFLVPFYLELVKSYSTDFSGLLVFSSTILVLIASPVSGKLADRFGAKIINLTGVILLTISLALLSLLDQTVGLLFIFTALAIRALADGIANPANSKLVMSHSAQEYVGSISSILNTARYLGLVMGVVIFETIFDVIISLGAIGQQESAQGALELTLPATVLVNGFQTAFTVGLAFSIIIIIFTFLTHEKEIMEGN